MVKRLSILVMSAVLMQSLCACSPASSGESSEAAAETTTLVPHSMRGEYAFAPTLSELSRHSQYVIEGEIETAEITVIGGETFDVLEIRIAESHRGGLGEGDLITVYTSHGLEDFSAPQAGEAYLCFLADASDSRPEGTYEAVMGHACSFFVRDEEIYTNYFTAEIFRSDELENALQAQ